MAILFKDSSAPSLTWRGEIAVLKREFMRTVFTIDLPRQADGFASDDVLISLIDAFGWELTRFEQLTNEDVRAIMGTQRGLAQADLLPAAAPISTNEPTPAASVKGEQPDKDATSRIKHYMRLSNELFRDMPEVAAAERQSVIFMGYLPSDQVLFVITRMVRAQVTFRLLHRELSRLQSGTEKMMKRVLTARLNGGQVYVGNPTVYVYERGHDHVILTGRVIIHPLLETARSDLKDTLFFIVPLILFIPTAVAAIYFPLAPPPAIPSTPALFWKGSLDRISTALVTTALVSALGLLQRYIEIRWNKIIDWGFAKRKN